MPLPPVPEIRGGIYINRQNVEIFHPMKFMLACKVWK